MEVIWVISGGVIPIYTVHLRGFWRLEGAPSFVPLEWVIICDLNFKRTENHNFTVTTNTSQHVDYFTPWYLLYFSEHCLVEKIVSTRKNIKLDFFSKASYYLDLICSQTCSPNSERISDKYFFYKMCPNCSHFRKSFSVSPLCGLHWNKWQQMQKQRQQKSQLAMFLSESKEKSPGILTYSCFSVIKQSWEIWHFVLLRSEV